jgi:hypothetical protein
MLTLEMNRSTLLERFLELCNIDCKGRNLSSLTTRLQVFGEESTPDATIMESNGQEMLYIESKLQGGVDYDQLVRHVRSGKGNVPVVCVSQGKIEPPEIEEARETLTQQGFSKTLIRWVSWQQIYAELDNLPYKEQKKTEIEGLRKSLESESIAAPVFKGFQKSELIETSQFVKSYPIIFQNAKQLIEDIIEYVKAKDSNVDVDYSKRQSTTFPIMSQVSAGFRYLEMRLNHANLSFDLSKDYLHQEWGQLSAKQLKALDISQMESILAALSKEGFKLERYNRGNLEDVQDLEILKQIPDELGVVFSRYYRFTDDVLYINPQELVRFIGDGVLWMLNFFKTRDLYER